MKRKIMDHGNYKTVWYGDSWDKNGLLETPSGYMNNYTEEYTCISGETINRFTNINNPFHFAC